MMNHSQDNATESSVSGVAMRTLSSDELDQATGGFIPLAAAFGVAVDVALVVGAAAAVGYAIYKIAKS